jgi:NAD(P)-dependent dehydrogenase (short-subunit alcohol dehydrogenase family)
VSALDVVVTGANRGIGLEFVRQYLARGERVAAAVRDPATAGALLALGDAHPGALRVLACDVGDDASVADFARAVGDGPVDVLVNNAGVRGEWTSLESMDPDEALRTFSVNALGPLRVTRALLPNLLRSRSRKVAHVSSGMGSIGDNTSGGAYSYCMSKAALNMASRSMAADLRDRGVISVAFNPGWVQTDMGGRSAPLAVGDSVRALVGLIDGLTLARSGAFLDWRGTDFEW